jgi:predicted DNA repair protein MutK
MAALTPTIAGMLIGLVAGALVVVMVEGAKKLRT